MNHEATDFAAYRYTQRTSETAARRAYAGEHYAPRREHHWPRVLVCLLAAVAIVAMLFFGSRV